MNGPVDRGSEQAFSGSRLSRALAAPGGTLLLLRAFLGITFAFAGLQKLANPDFFSPTAGGSFQSQLRGSIITSPLHHLLDPALRAPALIAVLVALGEVAVGLGTLVGLFGRLAATGGALLSLSFFLTVSFRDSPYYYGADIVFLFAWTPFVLGGFGAWSLDGVYARRAERARTAMRAVAPQVGMTNRQLAALRRHDAELDRRTLFHKAATAGVVALTGLTLGGVVSALGRLLHTPAPSGAAAPLPGASGPLPVAPSTRGPAPAVSQPTSSPATSSPATSSPATSSPATSSSATSSPATSSPATSTVVSTAPVPQGALIGPAADVPVGGAASFTDPASQVPALVVQVTKGAFRAFSAVCPHAGCTVQFDGANDVFACPCHGSVFSAATGAVLQGPAPTGLSPIPVALGPNGELYVDG